MLLVRWFGGGEREIGEDGEGEVPAMAWLPLSSGPTLQEPSR